MQKSLSDFMNLGPNGSFGRPSDNHLRTRAADVRATSGGMEERASQVRKAVL